MNGPQRLRAARTGSGLPRRSSDTRRNVQRHTAGWGEADCANRPDLDWFSEAPAMVAAVKAVCTGCAVLRDCRTDALERQDPWGVQAALTAAERAAPTLLVLADPGPPPHVPSRGCYVEGCRRPECTALNASYQAELRSRGPATRAETVDVGEQLEIGAA